MQTTNAAEPTTRGHTYRPGPTQCCESCSTINVAYQAAGKLQADAAPNSQAMNPTAAAANSQITFLTCMPGAGRARNDPDHHGAHPGS